MMIGQTLSHYRITAKLGEGGMGEVYRATDTTLDREVAIKVLPAALADDPERLARFEREAKLLAPLNHPNIATIYGFESATLDDGSRRHFLAMELVEGEDLAERLTRGPSRSTRRSAIAHADRRGARGGPREGHRPPRPQARQRQGHPGRQGQGARLRPGQGHGPATSAGGTSRPPTSRSRRRSPTRAPRPG